MENLLPSTLQELVYDALAFGLTGEQVDALVEVSGGNYLTPDKPVPFIKIVFEKVEQFEKFINSNQVDVVMTKSTAGFVVVYPFKENALPLARVYMMVVSDFFLLAKIGGHLEKKGIRSVPMLAEEFEKRVEVNGYEQRMKNYLQKRKERDVNFAGLAEGRAKSTIVKKGAIFNSEGCFVCGKDATLITGTLSDMEDGIIFGFYLCPQHSQEASKEGPLLNYLSILCGGKPIFTAEKMSKEFLIDAVKNFLESQLDCKIEKIILGERKKHGVLQDTITAVRKSGIKIIFRMSGDGSYAYMIYDGKKQIKRIDNADHYNVQYGPDHIHLTPDTDNKNVKSSFTYGLPFIDAKIIKDVLDNYNG